ncbi:MAG: hypothetical protein HY898_29625 [Deltaproteobacteria bacterium]|jgi:hypothetical protein|nr:hypothetical protein [Deltaproteobacteria bacterium]
MVSPTTQTETIRRRKRTTSGKQNKKLSAKIGTPKFPVHPEGYDPNAADAKPAPKAPDTKKA